MMDAIGIIPARYGSTRFEGKVLADLGGKPVIQHVYERAKQAKMLDDLIVACDNERVKNAVLKFGGKVIFTSPDQPTGTDRLTEAVNPIDVKVVVNIQGDEPFVHSTMIDSIVPVLPKLDDAADKAGQEFAVNKKGVVPDSEIDRFTEKSVLTQDSGTALKPVLVDRWCQSPPKVSPDCDGSQEVSTAVSDHEGKVKPVVQNAQKKQQDATTQRALDAVAQALKAIKQ